MSDSRNCDLSVVVPAYNAVDFLGRAIRSVLDQIPSGRSVEVLVVDDGSTDDTMGAVNDFGDPEWIRCLRQENQGPSAARNLGLEQARGDLVTLLDADDELCAGCIETTIDFFARHPEVGMLFTNYEICDELGVISPSGVDTWQRFRSLPHAEAKSGEWIFTESLTRHVLEVGGFYHTSGLSLRRILLPEIGLFRQGFWYAEDDEFFARAAYATTVGYADQVLARKRRRATSLSHNPANMVRNARQALELAELQRQDYRTDSTLVEILDRKIPVLATWYCWELIHAGLRSELRKTAGEYLRRYPGTLTLYRLWLRSLVPG